jgi:hypothetical protein
MVHPTDREWVKLVALVRGLTSTVDAKKREENHGHLA